MTINPTSSRALGGPTSPTGLLPAEDHATPGGSPTGAAQPPSASSTNDGADEGTRSPSAFRGDIQALRAFAVVAVILNHLWPHRLTGGFIGVDIFFVISGFLISTHLFKDTLQGRRVALLTFYSRRIRRLLPAAFLVLVLSAIGVILLMPAHAWNRHLSEIMASAAYSENIYLAVQAVDYHALGQGASVAQHYWSLSVEEQFYFLWPMLLMLVAEIARRTGRSTVRVTGWSVGVFTVVFLAFSVWFTAYSPAQAYFVTPVRFWEFGIGALTALLVLTLGGNSPGSSPAPRHMRPRRSAQRYLRRRAIIAGLAWVTLTASAFLYSAHIPFPSATALVPVIATAVIITMGTDAQLPLLDRVTSLRPIRWTGDISYSLYLWHWPLIVLAPEITGDTLIMTDKLAILALTFVLAGLSKPLIEDAGLAWAFLARSVRRTFIAMLVAILAFAGITTAGVARANQLLAAEEARIRAEQDKLAQEIERAQSAALLTNDPSAKPLLPCLGPGSLLHRDRCNNAYDKPLTTALGPDTNYYVMPEDCSLDASLARGKFGGVVTCDFRPDPQPNTRNHTILMVGDSHVDQWKWPLYELAKKHHLRLEALIVGGCPVRTLDTPELQQQQSSQFGSDCTEGVLQILDYVQTHPADRVVYSTYARTEPLPEYNGLVGQQALYNDALGATWSRWLDAGHQHIYVITDTPFNDSVRDVNCFSRAKDPAVDCRVDRSTALGSDPLPGAVQHAATDRITTIDFTNAFCDDSYCYAVAGQMPIYFDPTHVNRQYTLLLNPLLEWELRLAKDVKRN